MTLSFHVLRRNRLIMVFQRNLFICRMTSYRFHLAIYACVDLIEFECSSDSVLPCQWLASRFVAGERDYLCKLAAFWGTSSSNVSCSHRFWQRSPKVHFLAPCPSQPWGCACAVCDSRKHCRRRETLLCELNSEVRLLISLGMIGSVCTAVPGKLLQENWQSWYNMIGACQSRFSGPSL